MTWVHGFRANGKLWKVNQLAFVSDAYQGIERDLLIARTVYRYDEQGELTEMALSSPEAFDERPVDRRRTNQKSRSNTKAKPAPKALDTTAYEL